MVVNSMIVLMYVAVKYLIMLLINKKNIKLFIIMIRYLSIIIIAKSIHSSLRSQSKINK